MDNFSKLAEAQTDAEVAALLRRWAFMVGDTDDAESAREGLAAIERGVEGSDHD